MIWARAALSSAFIFGGVALACASPARTNEQLNGTYTLTFSDSRISPSTWSATQCGPGCAHVTSDRGWSANARLADGLWTLSAATPTAIYCADGSVAPGTANFTVDAASMKGTIVSKSAGPACGSPGVITGRSTPFTLTKTR